METFSALLALCAGNSPVTGEFPKQRPVTRSVDAFFDLRLNKRLSKQSWGWWYETPSCSLWRHCNVKVNSSESISHRTIFHRNRFNELCYSTFSTWHFVPCCTYVQLIIAICNQNVLFIPLKWSSFLCPLKSYSADVFVTLLILQVYMKLWD